MLKDLGQAIRSLGAETRRSLWLLLLSFTLVAALDVLGIGLVFPIMMSLFSAGGDTAGADTSWVLETLDRVLPDAWNPVAVLALAMVGVFLAKNVLAALLVRWQYSVLSTAEATLGTRLFRKYLNDPWREVNARNSAELIRNASVSTSQFFLAYLVPMTTLVAEGLLILAVFVMLLVIDAQVAVSASALLIVAGVLYYLLVRNRLRAVGQDFQRANLELIMHLKQGIGAGREIRVLGREEEFVRQVAAARGLYARAQARRAFYTQIPRYYLESVLVVAVALGVVVALPSRDPAELGAVMALFAVAALRLMTSANRMLGALQQVRIGTDALHIVHSDLVSAPAQARSTGADCGTPADRVSGLKLDGVCFAYDTGGTPALESVSFDLPERTSLGIVGPSGSGKSTLIDILLGLLAPDHGTVSHDGTDIHRNLAAWRRMIGFVPQTIYLTDDSLRRNVAFGIADEAINEDAVRAALRLARLDEFVNDLPAGLDTPLGDMGARLSGGQRQRVGIARALYHDPQIMILDEATSALDGETEQAVVESVEALAKQKTLIVVAHRLSTVRRCARLLVLEQGKVAGYGPTEPLLAGNTVIRRMLGHNGKQADRAG